MGCTAVIAATERELTGLAGAFKSCRCRVGVPWETFEAHHGSNRLIFAVSGIGTSNAAAVTAALIHIFSPSLIVNTGCAGAYAGSGLAIGDLAIARTEFFADAGILTPDGWNSLEYMGFPLAELENGRHFNEIPLSRAMADRASRMADEIGTPLSPGRFLTVSTCSGAAKRGYELRTRFGGICENMEGAAVALVAARYGIDCLEIRGISNGVEDRDLSRWDIPLAVASAQNYLEHFLRDL